MKNAFKPFLPFIFLLLLAAASSACKSSGAMALDAGSSLQSIGFDFANQNPASPEGDIAAKNHLFIHQYPVPTESSMTEIAYMNDSDTNPEEFDLLVLRPFGESWTVVYRIQMSDDVPPAKTGITMVNLPYPILVQKNDIFAHWQEEAGGAIPVNVDNQSIQGLSVGQYGFHSADIEVGQQITKDGYTGQRDYFLNVLITSNP